MSTATGAAGQSGGFAPGWKITFRIALTNGRGYRGARRGEGTGEGGGGGGGEARGDSIRETEKAREW